MNHSMDLEPNEHEEVAIYEVNQRIPNGRRIAKQFILFEKTENSENFSTRLLTVLIFRATILYGMQYGAQQRYSLERAERS